MCCFIYLARFIVQRLSFANVCLVLSAFGTCITHTHTHRVADISHGRPAKQATDTCLVSIVGIITDKWMPTASFPLQCSDDGSSNTNKNSDYDDDGFHVCCIPYSSDEHY